MGSTVRFGARTRSVGIVGGRVKTMLEDGSTIISDRALVAIGRIACSDTLNLSVTGIEPGRAGVIYVNDNMQTSVPHIYAVGDVGERKTPLDLAPRPYRGGRRPAGRQAPAQAALDASARRISRSSFSACRCWPAPG